MFLWVFLESQLAAGCDVLCPDKSLSVVLVILKTVSLCVLLLCIDCWLLLFILWFFFFLILFFGESWVLVVSEDVFCCKR